MNSNILPIIKRESDRTRFWRNKINNLSPSFTKALEDIKTMPDTFGICGLFCYHVMGHLTIPAKWKDIHFKPIEDKAKFENFESLQRSGNNTTTTPATKFLEDNSDKFTRKWESVRSKREIESVINSVNKNQQIFFAIVCNYPKHEGQYTHMLTLLEKNNKNTVIIAGDLSPFGIADNFVVEVDFDSLADDIISTLEKSPSTKNSVALSKTAIESGSRDENKFTSNVSVATFN